MDLIPPSDIKWLKSWFLLLTGWGELSSATLNEILNMTDNVNSFSSFTAIWSGCLLQFFSGAVEIFLGQLTAVPKSVTENVVYIKPVSHLPFTPQR